MRSFIDLYSSPNIVRMIKGRRKWWTGHAERMHSILAEILKGGNHLGDLGVDRSILLKWISEK
jgi:hypothetical protein